MAVPEDIDWMIWRPVIAGVATLQEVESHWSITDLLDARDAMDFNADLQREAHKRAREDAGK